MLFPLLLPPLPSSHPLLPPLPSSHPLLPLLLLPLQFLSPLDVAPEQSPLTRTQRREMMSMVARSVHALSRLRVVVVPLAPNHLGLEKVRKGQVVGRQLGRKKMVQKLYYFKSAVLQGSGESHVSSVLSSPAPLLTASLVQDVCSRLTARSFTQRPRFQLRLILLGL